MIARTVSLSIALLFLASPAHAKRGGGRDDDGVVVNALVGTVVNNQATVVLELSNRTWKTFHKRGITPMLNLRFENEQSPRTYQIADAKSQVVVDLPFQTDAVQVWLTGEGRDARIAYFTLGGVDMTTLWLHLGTADGGYAWGPPVQTVNWASQPAVVQACGASSDMQRCLAAASRASFDPTALFETCRQQMGTTETIMQCVELGVSAPLDPTRAVATCRSTMDTWEHITSCIGFAVRARFEPSATIEACRRAGGTWEQVMQCIDITTQGAVDAAPVVDACRASMRTWDQWAPCLTGAIQR